MTIARTSGSAPTSSSAAISSSISASESAFRFSGRFSVIRAAGGSTRTSRCSRVAVAIALKGTPLGRADASFAAGPLLLAQHVLLDFPGRGLRERAELDRVRALVVGKPVAGERDDLVRARARIVPERHERLGAFPPVRMGDRDDGALEHG